MSHSAAIFLARVSSFFFSPLLTRQFSSSTTWPGFTSTPSTQFVLSGTGTPSSSDNRFATGASESSGFNSPSAGRPRCEVTMTAAPEFSACLIAGTEARMRVSSVMLPAASCGTFRSARMNTRLPRRSRSVMRRIVMVSSQHLSATENSKGAEKRPPEISGLCFLRARCGKCFCLLRVRKRNRDIQHAVAEAPLVVIPGAYLHQRAFRNLGERRVEHRRRRVVVEIDRHQGILVVLQDALEVGLRGLLHRVVHLFDRGRALGDKGEIHQRHID